ENANNFTGAAFEWNLATLTLTITFPRTPDNISVPDRVELRVFDNGGTPEIAMRDLNDQNFAVTTGEHISIVDVNGRNVMNWDIGTPGTDPNFDNGNIINMNGQIISSFIGNDNDWTMEMFIRETNFTQGGNVDVLMFHTGPNRIGQVTVGGETLGREAPGTFRIESQTWFYVTIPGGATGRFAARPSVNAGDWGHLFIVRNSETERLDVFRNGIHVEGAQQLGWASAAESFNNIDYAAIGPFRGANSQLYQFAIQEGALTATQVAARRQNVLHTLFQLEGFETNDIIFNLQGGNWDGNTQAVTIRVPVGIGMNVYQLLPANPVLAGSNFYGWNTQANGEGIFVTGDTVITDDITELFAIWVSEISVTFDSYIGRFPDNTTTREAILPVDSPSFTSNPAQWPVDPVLPGFVFDGWWTLRSSDPINDVGVGNGLSVLNFGTQLTQATTLTANMTVFARWRLDENLNIHRIEYRINNEDQLEARVYGASNVRLLTIPVNVTNNAFEVQQPNIVNVNGIRVIQNQRIDLGPIFTSLFGNNEWTLEYYMRASNTDNPARFGRQPGTGNLWGGILIEGGTGANSHNHFFITRPQDGGTGARRTQWRVLMNPDAGWVHVAQVLRPGVNELFTYTNGMFRQGSNGVNHREHFSGVRMRHLYYNWIGGNGFWVHGVTMHNTAFDEVNFTNVGVHETLDLLREGVPPLPPND
ncbi:MAG: InlB B-repeat-containing protein, partial [Treponema sp.]|nr:InlB B-repeat-containing protein [Treponema sp.]